MAAAFARFPFVGVVFVAALVAIVLQCLVYPIRHLTGLRVARLVHKGSLVGFVVVSAIAISIAAGSGDLASAIGALGWGPVLDFVVFILLTMFISYFMGDRYLADQIERER